MAMTIPLSERSIELGANPENSWTFLRL